jgi:conjugative transfer pilus assembly protein TraH
MLKARRLPLVSLVAWSMGMAPSAAHAGDLNAEVTAMFNNLGTVGNYTAPGAFKGQTFNTYSGGNLYLRSPAKTYQLTAIQFPSAKGGCGGIDLFGGSFSHISATEFKDGLKNITAALPGVAFELALESVSPLLGGLTKWAQGIQDMINNARINSCETATSLVASAAEAGGFDAQRACAKLAVMMGKDPDIDSAMRDCASNSTSILASARSSSDPDAQALAPFVGNLTWKALQTVTTLDDPGRELVMSMVGTVIFHPESDNVDPDVIAPSITSVKNLLYGQADAGNGNIYVQLLRCNNYTACDVVTQDNSYVHQPLTTMVEQMMRDISDHIQTRTPIPNNTAAVGFINSTSIPVWRMLSVGNSIPGSGLADTLIYKYREVIAADYAATFLTQFTTYGLAALQKSYRLTPDQQKYGDKLLRSSNGFLDRLQLEQQTLFGKVSGVANVTGDLEQLERNLRSNMTNHVLDMLGQASNPYR